MSRRRLFFSSLVSYETSLWNAIDRRMAQSGAPRLGRLEYLRLLHPGAVNRVQDAAESLGITVGAASKLTDRLVADGLVQRMPHPTDRRSSLLQLTTAGATALETGDAAFERAIDALLGGLDPAAVASLTALLGEARDVLSESEGAR